MKQLLLFLSLTCPLLAQSTPTLDPEALAPGDTGYGLSVFHGTAIEKFQVKVMGVLKNPLAGQDMILIRCSGQGLEQAKVVAGMSGSPIYIKDRLIGALAYGWSYSTEPIAGVTPIRNMLAELAPSRHGRAPGDVAPAGLSRLANPLLVWGIPQRVLNAFEGRLSQAGLVPVAGGIDVGALSTGASSLAPSTAAAAAIPKLEAGSAVAVQMMRGDLGMAAVGTVTWREGQRVLAFGHPFMGVGRVSLPAGPAYITGVMPRMSTSFKFGTPLGEEGSMVFDGQAGIVLATDQPAHMLPMRIRLSDPDRPGERIYKMEMIQNPNLTPMMVMMGIGSTLEACGGTSEEVTVGAKIKMEFTDGRTATLDDLIYVGKEALFSPAPLAALLAPLANPMERIGIKSVDVDLTFHRTRLTAQIRRIYLNVRELVPGATAQLHVVYKPFGQQETARVIPFRVPEDAAGSTLELSLQTGAKATPDVAPPEKLADIFTALKARYRSTDAVLTLGLHGHRLHYRGQVLKRLPQCIMPLLDTPNQSGAESAPEVETITSATPWVLEGQQKIKVPVKEVRF